MTDSHVKNLIKLGFIPISCNDQKRPICKGWTNINMETAVANIKPNCNLGILTGNKSKIIVIDVDVKDKGLETWEKIIKKHGEPSTIKVRTGNGGLHYYFNYTDKLKSDSKVVIYEGEKVGIDIKNDGGYVVCPPSINAEGKKYMWINKPGTIELCDIPEWFFQYMKTKPVKKPIIKKEKKITKKNNKEDTEEDTKEDTEKDNEDEDEDTDKDINDIIDKLIKDSKNIEDKEKKHDHKKNKKKDQKKERDKKKLKPDNAEDKEELECERLHDKTHIAKLLSMLSLDRVDSYQSWINVGMCLFNSEQNSNDYFDLWKEWSKSSDKYKKGVCEEKWVTFKKQEDGLTVGSLHFWAKEDNIKEYEKFKKQDCIHHFLKTNHDDLSIDEDDVIEVNNIVSNPIRCTADIGDKYCMLSKSIHDKPGNYIDMFKKGAIGYIACKDVECDGKILKDQMIPLDDKTLQILFNSSKNITIIGQNNNNYFYGEMKDGDDIWICDDYDIFEDKEFNKLVMESLNNAAYDLAEVLWYICKDKFNCTEEKAWYMYKDHRWIHGKAEMRNEISKTLPNTYKTVLKYYKNLSKNEDTEAKQKELKLKIKRITELIDSLKKTGQKQNIVTEAEDVFYLNNKTFASNLDQNVYLIGFENGIYDLNKMKFRDGKPCDNITFSVGYKYDKKISSDELNTMLEQIIPNEQLRKYFLKLVASCLSGESVIQKFFCCSGIGANGKSLLFDLISKTFGEYFSYVPVALITQKRQGAENASPQLLRTINKRIIVFSESNKNDAIELSIMKELTGGDKIVARGLHQNPIEFKPQFTPFILCNHLPQLDANDDFSVWRRMRSIKFTSTFVDKPNKNNPNEYKRNDRLSTNFDAWKIAFMNILIDHYKLFKEEGLEDIKEVLDATNEYKLAEDIYAEFVKEYLTNTNDKDDYIVWTALKQSYETWYKDNYHKTLPNAKEIKKYFEDNVFKKECVVFKVKGNTYRGWTEFKFNITKK